MTAQASSPFQSVEDELQRVIRSIFRKRRDTICSECVTVSASLTAALQEAAAERTGDVLEAIQHVREAVTELDASTFEDLQTKSVALRGLFASNVFYDSKYQQIIRDSKTTVSDFIDSLESVAYGNPSAVSRRCIWILREDLINSCEAIIQDVAGLLSYVPENKMQAYCKTLDDVAEQSTSLKLAHSSREDRTRLQELRNRIAVLLPKLKTLQIKEESKKRVYTKVNGLVSDIGTYMRALPDEDRPVSRIVASPPGDVRCDALGRYVDKARRHLEIRRLFPTLRGRLSVLSDAEPIVAILRYATSLPGPYNAQGDMHDIDKPGAVVAGDFFRILRNSDSFFPYLYVRKCYVEFRKMVMRTIELTEHKPAEFRFQCLLSGMPGIGKSGFMIYHIVQLLREFFHSRITGPQSTIFLAIGGLFYVYSGRAGWFGIEMEAFEDLGLLNACDASWILSDNYDIGFCPRVKTLLVAPPYRRYYREYKKFSPEERFLPTWSCDEVQTFFNYLEGLASAVSLEISQGSTRPSNHAPESSDEIARNFVDNPNGMPLVLTKDRLWDRFFHRGGVVRLLFKLVLLPKLDPVSSGKISAVLWSKIRNGTICMEHPDDGLPAPTAMFEHAVLEFAVTEDYCESGSGYTPISPYAMKLMSDECSLFSLDELISTISSKDCDRTRCFYFESLCLKYLSYQPADQERARAVYLRKMWPQSEQDQNMIFEIPKVRARSFGDLRHLVDIGARRGGLVFAQPASYQQNAFDAFYLPGIALQFTICAEQKWSSKSVILESLCDLLKHDVWGFPPKDAMYKLCYVVPDKIFTTFKLEGLARRSTPTCRCAYRKVVCTDCCFRYFEPYVIGIPNLSKNPIPSSKFGPFSGMTISRNGQFVRLDSVAPGVDFIDPPSTRTRSRSRSGLKPAEMIDRRRPVTAGGMLPVSEPGRKRRSSALGGGSKRAR